MQQNLLDVERTAKITDSILAELKNEIAGAIAYYPPGKSNFKYFDSQWASLRLLAVAPQHRRKGIEKAKQDNANAIALYTSEAIAVAQKMYGSLGFKQVRELPMMLDLRYWLYLYLLPAK